MSIPREILDQLLSGYLDDALSNDEQTRIEQLLQDDSDVATELEDLRRIRGSLRQISRNDAKIQLDGKFAERVLDAAVAQATAEGLGDEHPLVRVAEQPDSHHSKRIPIVKIATALVALAASIAIAIVTLQPQQAPIGLTGSDLAALDKPAEPNPDAVLNTPTDSLIASADTLETDTRKAAPETAVSLEMDSTAQLASKEPSSNNSAAVAASDIETNSTASTPSVEMIAARKTTEKANAKPSRTELPTEAEAAAMLGESNVLTFLVKRTEFGRQTRSVREAMRGATIKPAQEKALTEGMVSAVASSLDENESGEGAGTQLLYLEIPAKKADVLFARLLADEQGIESVGLGMIATPPVRRFVQSIGPEGVNSIRHSQSWAFQGNAVDKVAQQLTSGQVILPMNRSIGRLPLISAEQSDGPDQLSRLLILIR